MASAGFGNPGSSNYGVFTSDLNFAYRNALRQSPSKAHPVGQSSASGESYTAKAATKYKFKTSGRGKNRRDKGGFP